MPSEAFSFKLRVGDDLPRTSGPLLTHEEEIELGRRVKAGDMSARDTLVVRNIGLVVKVASKYMGRQLGMDDLFAEGCTGLIRGAELFDPDAGCRFTTYAAYWIQQAILRALGNAGHIRVPHYAQTNRNKVRDGRLKLADMSTMQQETVKAAGDVRNVAHLSVVTGDQPRFLDDITPDTRPGPAEMAATSDEIAALRRALNRLPEREASVLRRRFGIDEPAATLKEIGDSMGTTREWARLLELRGLELLSDLMTPPGEREPKPEKPKPPPPPVNHCVKCKRRPARPGTYGGKPHKTCSVCAKKTAEASLRIWRAKQAQKKNEAANEPSRP